MIFNRLEYWKVEGSLMLRRTLGIVLSSTIVLSASILFAGCAESDPPIAATSATSPPARGCDIFKNLTEKFESESEDTAFGPYPSVGDSSAYITYLFDSKGTKIGTVYGESNVSYRQPDGDIIEYTGETIDLPGGTVKTAGFFDINKGLKGIWEYLPVLGVSGIYRGKLGRRSFQIVKPGILLNAEIELCQQPLPAA